MNAPAHVQHFAEQTEHAPGYRIAQLALARAIASKERCSPVAIAQLLFASDAEAIAVVRSATGAADTATAGWAAALVRSDSLAMLRDIEPISAGAQLAARGVQVGFNNDAVTTRVPAVPLTDASSGAAWVGEGGVIPVLKGAIGGARVTRYKLGGIAALSQELERTSDAVEVLRQLLRVATASLLDRAMFDSAAAVPFVRPAGLLNGVTLTAGSGVGGLAAMAADCAAMHARMLSAGVGATPIVVVNSAVLTALSLLTLGSLGGLQIVGTPAVPADVALMIDTTYLATAFDAPEIDLDGSASITMADADLVAPTQAMTTAGAIGATAEQVPPDRGISVSGGVSGAANVGYQALSLFQTWSLGLRLVWPAGFGMALPGAVQGLSGITWATAP